jgi:hypothetical protein
MQVSGNQLAEVMTSVSSEAVDLISVSSTILLPQMAYLKSLDYFIIFVSFYICSHCAHGTLARDQRLQKFSSILSFR